LTTVVKTAFTLLFYIITVVKLPIYCCFISLRTHTFLKRQIFINNFFIVRHICTIFCIYKKYVNNFDVYFYLLSKQIDSKLSSNARLSTLQLTNQSQRSNSGKPLGTGYCEWLVVNRNVGKRYALKLSPNY